VNLLFTVIAILTVDRLGRRPLMIAGAAGMGISLVAIGAASMTQSVGGWLLLFVLGYIASFALSVGPVTWVILSEIFPTKLRGRALGVATFFLWSANFVVSQTFPMMDENRWLVERFHHGFPFFVYAAFCVVLVWVVAGSSPKPRAARSRKSNAPGPARHPEPGWKIHRNKPFGPDKSVDFRNG
jgi:MFS transporter, SP family, xylose:H+ symportor